MDQAVRTANNEIKNTVEIVVHITEDLEEALQYQVVTALKKTDGITGAEFCPLRNHLVLAKYNKDILSSQDVLNSFRSLNLDARLIGPI